MNSWFTFSPSHGGSSVSQWSYGLSIYVHSQDTIHILTHICRAQCRIIYPPHRIQDVIISPKFSRASISGNTRNVFPLTEK